MHFMLVVVMAVVVVMSMVVVMVVVVVFMGRGRCHVPDGLASVDDVAEWVTHGIQLPQYAETFRNNDISSEDLSSLLQDGGEAIESVLGITNLLHKKRILRAITVRLVGVASRTVASVPFGAHSARGCYIAVVARQLTRKCTPIHKYTHTHTHLDAFLACV